MNNDKYLDFYGIDLLLTEDEKMVRDAVRGFVDQECMPIIAEHFDKGTFPMETIARSQKASATITSSPTAT